jgi:C4-dicarboxylate transporter DctQ subunit
MKRILKFIDDRFEEIIGTALLAMVVTVVFMGVVLRLVFTSGLTWGEEVSKYGFLWVCYLGASYGIKSNDHIRITFVADALPERARKVLRVITDIIWIGFNIFIVVFSMDYYLRQKNFLGLSGTLYIPLHYVFLAIPVGFALLTLRVIQQYILKLIKPQGDVEADGPADQPEAER